VTLCRVLASLVMFLVVSAVCGSAGMRFDSWQGNCSGPTNNQPICIEREFSIPNFLSFFVALCSQKREQVLYISPEQAYQYFCNDANRAFKSDIFSSVKFPKCPIAGSLNILLNFQTYQKFLKNRHITLSNKGADSV